MGLCMLTNKHWNTSTESKIINKSVLDRLLVTSFSHQLQIALSEKYTKQLEDLWRLGFVYVILHSQSYT